MSVSISDTDRLSTCYLYRQHVWAVDSVQRRKSTNVYLDSEDIVLEALHTHVCQEKVQYSLQQQTFYLTKTWLNRVIRNWENRNCTQNKRTNINNSWREHLQSNIFLQHHKGRRIVRHGHYDTIQKYPRHMAFIGKSNKTSSEKKHTHTKKLI